MNPPFFAEVFVKGDPKAQPRTKAARRGNFVSMYTPDTAKQWRSEVAAALVEHHNREILCPVRIHIILYFRRPKSHHGTGRNSAILKPSAPRYHLQKPDVDNCAKAIMDVLSQNKNGIGLWKDDTQVVNLTIEKQWANGESGARITINEITP